MVDRRLRVVMALVVGALAVACKKDGQSGTATPDAMGTSPGGGVSDPLAGPEQALRANADELRAMGVVLDGDDGGGAVPASPEPEPEPEPEPDDDEEPAKPKPEPVTAATHCDAVCQLADTACELRTQICDLAQDHVGESRYEAACWRATDQCTRASTACDQCRGTTAGTADGCSR